MSTVAVSRPQAVAPPAELSAAGRELWQRVDRARLPRHVAIIMDGSGRWAAQRHRPRVSGHMAGMRAVRATVETCAHLGIPALTLYAFSVENWRRPAGEVSFLMRLLRRYLRSETAELNRQQVRLEVIGRWRDLPPAVLDDLNAARAATAANRGMVLSLALNYSAQAEIADACQALVQEARDRGDLATLRVTETSLAQHLSTAHLPELDLLIRSSGERRVSNFLLWQLAYAEIWITPVLWPDFRGEHLLEAVVDFQARERRFGGLGKSVAPLASEAAR